MSSPEYIFENTASANFAGLKGLIEEQATHHECTYRGDDEAFKAELESPSPVARSFLMREFNTNAYRGAIVYNKICGFKGEHLYIEDIIVSQKQRGGGIGAKMMEELRRLGREGGAEAISWLVAKNNAIALNFYQNKIKANEMAFVAVDASDLFEQSPTPANRYSIVPVTAEIIELMRDNAEAYPNLKPYQLDNAEKAVTKYEHADVLAAVDDEGHIAALAILNANYSSFRTVCGYKLEMLEMDQTTPLDNQDAFADLLVHIQKMGQHQNRAGHVTMSVDKSSRAQMEMAEDNGWTAIQMTDNPDSAMYLYTVSCAEVVEALKTQAINDNLSLDNEHSPVVNL